MPPQGRLWDGMACTRAGDVVWCGGAPRGMRRRGAVRDKLRVTDGTGAELGRGCGLRSGL